MPKLQDSLIPHAFRIGGTYNRRTDIHGVYKGQQQGGMSTPSKYPFIFLFTGEEGQAFGYEDGWADGVYVYTGEGQVGDMSFIRANKALRDHAINGKDVLLFEKVSRSGTVIFRGNFECSSWEYGKGKDENGELRKTIRFHLIPTQSQPSAPVLPQTPDETTLPLDELRKRAYVAASRPREASRSHATTSYYQRSEEVPRYVLARAAGQCELCRKSAPFQRKADGLPYLESHHLLRVSDSGPDHPRYVAGICPNCHREIHHGVNGAELNQSLEKLLAGLES